MAVEEASEEAGVEEAGALEEEVSEEAGVEEAGAVAAALDGGVIAKAEVVKLYSCEVAMLPAVSVDFTI